MNRLDGLRSLPWVDAVGWALLHSLWEGAAVAVSLAMVLCLLRRASAQARYVAACGAMVLLVALPASALWRSKTIIPNGTYGRAADRTGSGFDSLTDSGARSSSLPIVGCGTR